MWILISFAIIALVIFLVLILLKIEPLVAIVISVLSGLILAYFMENLKLTLTYTDPKNSTQKQTLDVKQASTIPTTSIHSSTNNSSSASNNSSSMYGFLKTG